MLKSDLSSSTEISSSSYVNILCMNTVDEIYFRFLKRLSYWPNIQSGAYNLMLNNRFLTYDSTIDFIFRSKIYSTN